MSEEFISSPSDGAIREAKKFPNGYVYAIDQEYENSEDVPAENIKGAWQVDSHGIIVGEFLPNPSYRKIV